jgi:transposase
VVTETLEVIPRRWKVVQTVREKFSCRECEKIAQSPAPFHVTPRGFVGPNPLAMILFEKFGQHQPLNRQSERYRREGIDLSVSTLADQVGAGATALQPLHALIEAHVLAAERLHADDTTVPILSRGRTVTGRIWTYVRDDRPFAGPAPPAALYYASRDRRQEHPERHLRRYRGILQADAYSGYCRALRCDRKPGESDEGFRPSSSGYNRIYLPESPPRPDWRDAQAELRQVEVQWTCDAHGLRAPDAFYSRCNDRRVASWTCGDEVLDPQELQGDSCPEEKKSTRHASRSKKESFRWLENMRQSNALLEVPERCVHVGDRESDIYELFCEAAELRTHFLV